MRFRPYILKSLKSKICISGPIPTFGCGVGRLLSLNSWLSSACNAHGVDFIDNFKVFWEWGELFWLRWSPPKQSWSSDAICQYIIWNPYHPCRPTTFTMEMTGPSETDVPWVHWLPRHRHLQNPCENQLQIPFYRFITVSLKFAWSQLSHLESRLVVGLLHLSLETLI